MKIDNLAGLDDLSFFLFSLFHFALFLYLIYLFLFFPIPSRSIRKLAREVGRVMGRFFVRRLVRNSDGARARAYFVFAYFTAELCRITKKGRRDHDDPWRTPIKSN